MQFGFVVTYYNSNPESQSLLGKTIDVLSKENYYLVLVSHSPIPEEIQTKCDFVIFESQNVIDERKYSHGVAENSLIKLAFKHLKDKGIVWAYKTCYDVDIVDIGQFDKWIKDYNYKLVTCRWGECSLATHSFFASVDFIVNTIPDFKTVDELFVYYNILEFAWEKIVKEKKLEHKVYSFSSKESLFGLNKMDTAYFNYDNVIARYSASERKFYIKNNGQNEIIGDIWIYDYYTDLCIYKQKNTSIPSGIEIWIIPPFAENLTTCQNGFYIEIDKKDGETIRRNLLIKNFDKKHVLSKKFRTLKKEEVKYNEYCDFKEFGIYKQLGLLEKSKKWKTIIDIGANFGFFSFPFIEQKDKKVYLIDADPHNAKLLKGMYEKNDNIKINHVAICDQDGFVDFYHHEDITVVSSLDPENVFGDKGNRKKVTVPALTPNSLLEQTIKEPQIDLLKIDIEGGEYQFFELVSDKNLQKSNNILIEYHPNKKWRALDILIKLAKNDFDYQFVYWGDKNDLYELDNDFGVIYAWR